MSKESKRLAEMAKHIAGQASAEAWVAVLETSELTEKITRRPFIADVIAYLGNSQRGICGICGELIKGEPGEIDHIIPISRGGGNEKSNLQLTHKKCNRSKGNSVSIEDLLDYLEDRYMNRQ